MLRRTRLPLPRVMEPAERRTRTMVLTWLLMVVIEVDAEIDESSAQCVVEDLGGFPTLK